MGGGRVEIPLIQKIRGTDQRYGGCTGRGRSRTIQEYREGIPEGGGSGNEKEKRKVKERREPLDIPKRMVFNKIGKTLKGEKGKDDEKITTSEKIRRKKEADKGRGVGWGGGE